MNIFLVKSIIGYARTMDPVIIALKTNISKKIAINKGLFPTVLFFISEFNDNLYLD